MLLHSASRAGIRDNFLGWLSDIQQKCISEYLWGVACISVRSGVWDQFPGTPQLFFLVRATLQRAPPGKPESFATYLYCRAAEKVAFYGGQMKALRPLRFPYKLCPAISWYRQSNLGHSLRDLALWFIGLDIVRVDLDVSHYGSWPLISHQPVSGSSDVIWSYWCSVEKPTWRRTVILISDDLTAWF